MAQYNTPDHTGLQAVQDYQHDGFSTAPEVVHSPEYNTTPEVVPYPEFNSTPSASPLAHKAWGTEPSSTVPSPLPAQAALAVPPGAAAGAASPEKGRIWGLTARVFWILVTVVAVVVILAVALGAGLGAGLKKSTKSSTADAAAGSVSSSTSATATSTPTSSTAASVSTKTVSASTTPSTTSSSATGYVTGSQTLPAATATATLTSSLSISCPSDNLTLYEDTSTDKSYILLCGRDYNADGGSVDLGNENATTLAECIGYCAANDTCTAAGWGTYYGVDVCWMKSSVGTPNESDGWYFVIEESGDNL